MNKIILSIAACGVLSACDKFPSNATPPSSVAPPPPVHSVDASCLSESAPKVLHSLISEAIENEARSNNKSLPEERRFDLSKVRALASGLDFQLQDIRTTKNDPDSSKKFCEAQLILRVPMETLEAANRLRRDMGEKQIQSVAEDAEFKVNMNKFSIRTSYNVQLTDDKTKIYVGVDNAELLNSLSSQIILFAALQNKVLAAGSSIPKGTLADAVAKSEPSPPATAPTPSDLPQNSTASTERSNIGDSDLRAYEAAEKEINMIWRALLKDIRDENLEAQREFNAIKEKVCFKEASAAGSGQQFEAAKNRCWLRMYQKRIPELRALGNVDKN